MIREYITPMEQSSLREGEPSATSWWVLRAYLLHLLANSLIFVVIFGFAFGMQWVRRRIQTAGVVDNALQFAEIVLITCDVLLFGIALVSSSFTLSQSMFRSLLSRRERVPKA